ncbi:hypothetical protein BY458DRAFT_486466 [Sporodiniella umbellata]|nr:hypothetical protein BY458DRAFT_486466 [Sporodiniella umbellata]
MELITLPLNQFHPQAFRRYPLSNRPAQRTPLDESLEHVSWTTFWKIPLPIAARNAWLRLLQSKIPSKLLHIAPFCDWCPQTIETESHFFFECTKKHALWSLALRRFFTEFEYKAAIIKQCAIQANHDLITPTADYNSIIASKIHFLSLIDCVLHTIWPHSTKKLFM